MATALGNRLLVRYAAGTATLAQLDAALVKEWITKAEYDAATSAPEPDPDAA